MKWSDPEVYQEIYDAIVFDGDDDTSLALLEKAVSDETVNVNETDEEGLSLLHHSEMNDLDNTCEFLKANGAVEED